MAYEIMWFDKIEDEGNEFGYDQIKIVEFNYDSAGTALVRADGILKALSAHSLDLILFGDTSNGLKWYEEHGNP